MNKTYKLYDASDCIGYPDCKNCPCKCNDDE